MTPSAAQVADFLVYARRPETWAIAARRQLAVARHLFLHEDSLRSTGRESFVERSGCHYSAYLHAGYAVENAAKAALVARDPSFICDSGRIDSKKLGPHGGHGLRAITESVLSNPTAEDLTLLDKLQDYVVWAGRYTVPKTAGMLFDEERMERLRVAPIGERDRVSALVDALLNSAGVST